MKKINRIFIFILVLVVMAGLFPALSNTVIAQNNYSPIAIQNFNGHTYAVYDVGMTWKEAKAYAENLGGHLVTITSQAENDFVTNLIRNCTKNLYWIGAESEQRWGYWKWVTGEAWGYTN